MFIITILKRNFYDSTELKKYKISKLLAYLFKYKQNSFSLLSYEHEIYVMKILIGTC